MNLSEYFLIWCLYLFTRDKREELKKLTEEEKWEIINKENAKER